MYGKRCEMVKTLAEKAGLSAVALIPGANMYYLTDFHTGLSERSTIAVIPVDGPTKLIVPELDYTRASEKAHVDEMFSYKDEDGPIGAVVGALSGLSIKGSTIGFEYRSMRVQELEIMNSAAGGFSYADAGKLFAALRMTKSGDEIEYMYKASAMVEAGMESALRHIAPGITEYGVEAQITGDLRKAGVTGEIHMSVVSGERTGSAHNGTSDRMIREGDLVWVDLMVSHEHYWADITRTFAVGQISSELQEVYQIVLEAQQAARERARPGMTGREIDAISRGIIESRGFGKYFTHRTGHGLGLEIHEEPYIVASNNVPLEAGMTFTIEPGIYLPGKGGVRVEDDVILIPGGCRSLTNFRRNLLTQKSRYVV